MLLFARMSATSKHTNILFHPIPLFYTLSLYTLLSISLYPVYVYLAVYLYCILYLPLAEVYTRFGGPWPAAGSGTAPDWPVSDADPAPFRPTVAGTYYVLHPGTYNRTIQNNTE